MPRADVNDIRMYYEIYGEGEMLLMIMGGDSDLLAWGTALTPFLVKIYVLHTVTG